MPRLVDRHVVWDCHVCMPLRPHDSTFLPQLARHRQAGTRVLFLNVGWGEDSIESHFRMLAAFRLWLEQHADEYVLLRNIEDIERARQTGRMAVGFDIEGANAIGDQLSFLATYYDLGVRWMLLAYNRNNRVGGGCQDNDSGLTDFGRAVIQEMARIGMMVCCSHTGERTALQAIDESPNPVIFSHSNPRSLHDHPRNVRDAVIKACAARGGVLGVTGISLFLGNDDASAERVVSHIDYVAQLVGVEHVGLGLDYGYDRSEIDAAVATMAATFPPELGYSNRIQLMPPEEIPAIADELAARGYRDSEVAAVLGGNFLRVAQQVWR